eukprot:jgi/Picre1/33378/NNA_008702.t1
MSNAPSDVELWWDLVPEFEQNSSEVADILDIVSPEGPKSLGWVDEKSIRKQACNACIKYWARAPDEEGNWQNCRKYMRTPSDLPIECQLLYYICQDKVRLECAEIAKVSQTEDEESLMKYLTTNHRGNYNQRVHTKDGHGYGEGWYTERGRKLLSIIRKYLEDMERESGHKRTKSTPEDLERIKSRVIEIEGFENWYSPDKYSFVFQHTKPVYGNLLNSKVMDDLHSMVDRDADPDWKIKGDWSKAMHKDVMGSIAKLVNEKDKLFAEVEVYRDEVETLKKTNDELRKRIRELENRRPGAKRGIKQRRTQAMGNEYAKEYKIKRRPLEEVRPHDN